MLKRRGRGWDEDTAILGGIPAVSIRSRNTQMMVGLYAHKQKVQLQEKWAGLFIRFFCFFDVCAFSKCNP